MPPEVLHNEINNAHINRLEEWSIPIIGQEPLLKGSKERLPQMEIKFVTMDADYDYRQIHEQIHHN